MIAHTPAKSLRVNFTDEEDYSKSHKFKMVNKNTLGAVFDWISANYESISV